MFGGFFAGLQSSQVGAIPRFTLQQPYIFSCAATMSIRPSRATLAKERSWFVGFTHREVDTTSTTTAAAVGRVLGEEVDELANKVSTGAVLSGIDPETERDPPERSPPATMPFGMGTVPVGWGVYTPPPDFKQLFLSIQRPEVILTRHVKALNFDHRFPTLGEDLFPARADGSGYITVREDGSRYVPNTDEAMEKSYADRIGELNISNDAAFRALSKTTKPGEQAPRLAHLRRFWIGLDNMAQYWTSEKTPEDESYVKRAGEPLKYKGRRIAKGSEMPDSYRADTVRALVEAVASAFQCRVTTPHVTPLRLTPVLLVNNLEQPVRLTGLVSRLPTDRDKARSGILEGPIMGILERNDTDFVGAGNKPSVRRSQHDFLREAAAMLLIAQERRRESKTAVTLGDGKWYTTRQRWGGAPGGKLPILQKREEEMAEIKSRLKNTESPSDELKKEASKAKQNLRQAQKMAEKWETMASKPAVWDKKTDYMAIGKEPGSDYDEIYLVSCLFHHVSLVKLTLHNAYIDYMTTGVMPDPVPLDSDWCIPVFERTIWLDLLYQKERTYAFMVIWAALNYMTRDTTVANTSTAEAGEDTALHTGGSSIGETATTQAGAQNAGEAANTLPVAASPDGITSAPTGEASTDDAVATQAGVESTGETAPTSTAVETSGGITTSPTGEPNKLKVEPTLTGTLDTDETMAASIGAESSGDKAADQAGAEDSSEAMNTQT